MTRHSFFDSDPAPDLAPPDGVDEGDDDDSIRAGTYEPKPALGLLLAAPGQALTRSAWPPGAYRSRPERL